MYIFHRFWFSDCVAYLQFISAGARYIKFAVFNRLKLTVRTYSGIFRLYIRVYVYTMVLIYYVFSFDSGTHSNTLISTNVCSGLKLFTSCSSDRF